MKTFKELLGEKADELTQAGVPEPELNAWHLLAWSVALSNEQNGDRSRTPNNEDEESFVIRLAESMPDRAWYMMHADEYADELTEQTYNRLIGYRKKRVPLEYITHYTEFMGLPFYVDPSVLIPRQDTECVVETALDILKEDLKDTGADALDLCTGSGCIAVSLAKLGKVKSVTATDKSAEALQVASKNAAINHLDIRFLQGDMWDPIDARFDLIISNPPYIRDDVMPTLMEEVRDYEPVMALNGGEDGLFFYRCITEKIGVFLRKGGSLIFEIGYDQGEDVALLMREAGLTDIEVKKDYAGCDRVVCGRLDV